MPTPADQLPSDATTLARRVADLERQVTELRAARRLESASVGAGGLAVVDGGRFTMDTPSGHRMVNIGPILNPTYNHGDGSQQQAIVLAREDGSQVLTCWSYPPSGSEVQFWNMYDSSGRVVIADDALSGSGLARPYLPVPMYPAFEGGWATWPVVNGTSMASLWSARFYKQQPMITVVALASMDTVGATGSLQLTIDGTPIDDPQSVGFSAGYFTFGPYALSAYGHMAQPDVSLQGRRDTGTGGIRANIYAAYTHQS